MRNRNTSLTPADTSSLAWEKMGGLLPAIVQDRASGRLLMLGYMNRDSLQATLDSGFATFFSRSKDRLWQKGETSGNRLRVAAVHADCDGDALLVLANPAGPTCHLGSVSCFGESTLKGSGWLADLSAIVGERGVSADPSSYTRQLLDSGIERIAQKIGEEGVEVALAAVSAEPQRCVEEVADLIYHLTVLMQAKGFRWDDVVMVLQARHNA